MEDMFEKICYLIEDVDDHPFGHFVVALIGIASLFGIFAVLVTFVLPVLIFLVIVFASVCVPIGISIFNALMAHFPI